MLKKAVFSCLAFALLCMTAAVPARAASMALVKISGQGDGARVVFAFPKLVGYHAFKAGTDLELTFDTPLGSAKPVNFPPAITGFDVSRPDAETLKVVIHLKPGMGFRAYRQKRSIVIDVSSGGPPAAAAPAPEKTAKAETPAPAKTEPPKKEAAATPSPAPEAAAPPPPDDKDRTKITIATVSPTRLAVFERFHYLWIVADGQVSSAFAPEVDGPQAGFVGKPRIFKFGAGTAWRYLMPPDSYVSVHKRSLAWDIVITPQPVLRPSSVAVSIDVDRASGRARLMALLPGSGDVMKFEDPSAGDTLFVVATSEENMRVDDPRKFADVNVLAADMGFVARPLRDGVTANRLSDFVQVTAPDGLIASSEIVSSVASTGGEEEMGGGLLFDFPSWRMGGIRDMYKNERALLEKIAEAKVPDDRQAALVQLARLYFANNFGQEALGVLRILSDENEEMAKTPDFIALEGAANAMAGHYQDALQYLSDPAIQQHPEVSLWIGYAAAATEQWHKANEAFPKSNNMLVRYPDNIAIPFTLYMAESALRLGHPDTAQALLGAVSPASEDFSPQYKAAIGYLRGETARQQGDLDAAAAFWEPVANGIDRLYHTKASLALANLKLQQKKLPLKDAIDQIDSLRFAWRGDGLEVQILNNLGDLKVKNGRYLDGLHDMKQAAALSDSLLDDSTPIRDAMQNVFTTLFVGGEAAKISPLEAASVYTEFSGLLPPGPDSSAASLHFADSLISMDLLAKAQKVLEDNLKSGGVPEAQVSEIGAKLAAIYLLDNKPADAITALDESVRGDIDAKHKEERILLKARAQSQLNQTDAAIATLSSVDSPDARRLKIDVLWRARKWDAAAAAIAPLLPAPSDKIDDAGARLVLNMTVASKLAGDAAKLEDLKTRYGKAMEGTSLGSAFSVVTRENGVSSLSDRETLMKMAGEADMFKDFLNDYKKTGGGS